MSRGLFETCYPPEVCDTRARQVHMAPVWTGVGHTRPIDSMGMYARPAGMPSQAPFSVRTGHQVVMPGWTPRLGDVAETPAVRFTPEMVGTAPRPWTSEPIPLFDTAPDDEMTFQCEWTDEHGTCNMDIIGDRVWMSHHLSRQHNVVGHERTQRACLWRGCTDTMNKGSLARHVVSRHLRAGASCGFCSKVYSRADVARRHTKKCKAAQDLAK